MNIELRHLRYVVALAEELHYGRAAARLRIAQPALSQQVARLEAAIGVRLFDRSTAGTRITDAGEAFVRQARRTLVEADRAVEVARRAAAGELGPLRVGFAPSTSAEPFLALLGAFGRHSPDVDVRLAERPTGQLVGDLVEGRLDVAFLALLRPPPTEGHDIVTVRLAQEPFVAALPADHPLAGAAPIAPARLAGERFAFFARDTGPRWYDTLLSLCHSAGFTPTLAHEVRDQASLLSLVAAGLAVGLVPASTAVLRERSVAYVPLTGAVPTITSTVAWSAGRRSPVLDRFLTGAGLHPPEDPPDDRPAPSRDDRPTGRPGDRPDDRPGNRPDGPPGRRSDPPRDGPDDAPTDTPTVRS